MHIIFKLPGRVWGGFDFHSQLVWGGFGFSMYWNRANHASLRITSKEHGTTCKSLDQQHIPLDTEYHKSWLHIVRKVSTIRHNSLQKHTLIKEHKIQFGSSKQSIWNFINAAKKAESRWRVIHVSENNRLLDMLKELTFIGVAITSGASGESVTANLSCMKRLSTMESSLRTIL